MDDPDKILKKIREYSVSAFKYRPSDTYRPPSPEDFRRSTVLCFDQTLSNCGWAILNTEMGHPRVSACGVIKPPDFDKGIRGFEATFTKSLFIARGLRELLSDVKGCFEEVALELPAVTGFRTESSLVSAVTIVQHLDELGYEMPEFIQRQSACAVLTGDRRAPKSVVKSVVEDLIEGRRPKEMPWNEHVHDAVFVGLMHLYERPK